jgi:hypothetical protein
MPELGEAVLSKLKVPDAMRLRVAEILAITDQVCVAHLDHEYAELCRVLVARLGRKRPSPLARGDVRIWAAGAIYTVGRVSFLFDRSQDPHMTADELAEHLGVVKSTMANKAALIAKTLDLGMFEPDLTASRCSSGIRWRGSYGSTGSWSTPARSRRSSRTTPAGAG